MHTKQLLNLHKDLCDSAKKIMESKNHDYSGASGDPFANFRGSDYLGVDPIIGILLRVQDKMQRIKTFTSKGTLKVQNEGVRDAIEDVINYMILIYGMIEDGKEHNSLDSPAEQSLDSSAEQGHPVGEKPLPPEDKLVFEGPTEIDSTYVADEIIKNMSKDQNTLSNGRRWDDEIGAWIFTCDTSKKAKQ